MIVCMLTHSLVSLEHSLRLMVRYTMHMRVIKSNKPIPLLVMLQLIYKSQLEWWLNGDGDVREAHSSHTLMGWYVAIAIISVVTTITTAASSHTHTHSLSQCSFVHATPVSIVAYVRRLCAIGITTKRGSAVLNPGHANPFDFE